MRRKKAVLEMMGLWALDGNYKGLDIMGDYCESPANLHQDLDRQKSPSPWPMMAEIYYHYRKYSNGSINYGNC